ncbi:MAG: patatin-like phospholipase family protein [Leptospiraceae bacterium]|nr:patatin-like phospholipase family protein [Leptospiraceae bacterium]MCP5503141.1 patatin-like phospholipase family protein [Leptospiraceae bacterium]
MQQLKDKLNGFASRYLYETCLGISGGGCKAIYALGVGFRIRSWGVRIKEISGVSAGSAMAFSILSETEEEVIEYMMALTRRNESNINVSNLLKGERLFPHENIYRRAVRYGLNLDKIRQSETKIHILSVKAVPYKGKFPLFNKAKLISETAQAYLKDDADREKGIAGTRVESIMKKWNMKEVIFTNKDLENPAVIEQIIMNSSTIPPVVSFKGDDRIYYLDGGLTNNLLLECFPRNSKIIGVHYDDTTIFGKDPDILKQCYLIRPSGNIPVKKFDYTDPVGIKEAFEMGKEDAERQKDKILDYCKRRFSIEEIKNSIT